MWVAATDGGEYDGAEDGGHIMGWFGWLFSFWGGLLLGGIVGWNLVFLTHPGL